MTHSKMKNTLIKNAGRYIIVCMLLYVIAGCRDEIIEYPSPADDYATVFLSIKTPGITVPHSSIRSLQTNAETAISDVKVLVCTDPQGDGIYRFFYMVNGIQLENLPDQTSRFQLRLRSSSVPLKLLVIANATTAFTEYTPQPGETEATIKTSVNLAFTSSGFETSLPMYGDISLPLIDATTITMLEATVLRAIARIDVKKQLSGDSPAFDLSEVYVYRANNRIQVIPDSIDTNGTFSVTAPSVPAGSTPLTQPLIKTAVSETDSIGGIYLPESNGFASESEGWQYATTIVVGGAFAGSTETTYYRVDFNSGLTGHPFGQVLRNYLYTFTIQKVTAAGYPTPGEALVNHASSMTVEIQQWQDFTTGMYFHDNYIGVSTRQVNIPFLPNYTKMVDVESSMNYEMLWPDTPESGTVSEPGVPISNGYFTATIVRNTGESSLLSHIRIESSVYNTTDQPVQDTLRLIANDTSVDIIVIKESPAQYAGRSIRVLSMGAGYGSLGAYNATVGVTFPMRNILDVNFSPSSSYPFKTGGFFFLTAPFADPAYSNATTPAAIASFKKLIGNFDVLIMTFENTTSPQVADMLLDEWLVEDPHRILWIMRDDAASNTALVARTARDGEGVWNNIADAFDANAGYRFSNAADYAWNNAQEVYEFFNGPFGTIDNSPGQQILRAGDIVSGASLLSDTAKQYVTPLVYSNKTGYTGYMSVGVNKKRGIVYQGESQFFQYNVGMSLDAYNSGAIVRTPDTNGQYYFDLLMANVWAWATGRVIYGPAT